MKTITIGKTLISVLSGDITAWTGDIIVNAANSGLLGGNGVDGAIHRIGGPEIMEQCKEIRKLQGGCPPGHAVITGAGNLDAKHVIHTVGPIWEGGGRGEAQTLADCYRSSLQLANEVGARSIAFPNISTGIYGYPKSPACDVALKAVSEFLREDRQDNRLEQIDFVCFESDNTDLYVQWLEHYV
ncbi:O-acetyl-ADP-ribose deacetylase (regulator of RNase III), contains Macro domain [Paenibacillus uliginis N3/975]|uniref:O-acetyl-ADP-ribose deacetylase (Regulator of RNase III), contains Macro domain n=1 Tax=Paenibacillus uliginis N3/975 TaxID=1313296 RepID=A0A1X7H994_9BACL|nr:MULTISPECIES: O-acetyl-ADP-ribose deacetylase [Paenibacillus]UNK16773.1 O-acetyl-ADP-ribose deacetylase [Paenibacillus sp. N3/727]SMF81145.1 O-acetyl-ADP-ribose deacetylase (regulator of RNase III), contains Macro domain [Paenibacillus uliginis N3/975]